MHELALVVEGRVILRRALRRAEPRRSERVARSVALAGLLLIVFERTLFTAFARVARAHVVMIFAVATREALLAWGTRLRAIALL